MLVLARKQSVAGLAFHECFVRLVVRCDQPVAHARDATISNACWNDLHFVIARCKKQCGNSRNATATTRTCDRRTVRGVEDRSPPGLRSIARVVMGCNALAGCGWNDCSP
jgi:hypothetical protein